MQDILITHYEAARSEVLDRMEMRQRVITLYLGFVGTVLGLAIGYNQRADSAIIIPLASLGAAWIIRDHELALSHLGIWLQDEYQKYLESIDELKRIPHWDASHNRRAYGWDLVSRFIGYGLLFLIADLIGVFLAWKPLSNQAYLRYVGLGLTIATAVTILSTYVQRRRMRVIMSPDKTESQ